MANENSSLSYPSLLPNRPQNYSLFPTPGTISNLFDSNKRYLYHKFPSTFDYGNELLTFGPKQPYIYTYPDETDGFLNRLKKYETGLFPLAQTTEDLTRLGKFMISGRGILFLLSQQLAQNQNVFNETSLYNPTEVLLTVGSKLVKLNAPTRHLDQSRGALGMLAGLVGLSSIVGAPQPPKGTVASSQGVANTLPERNIPFPTGLLRAKTAIKAKSMLEQRWASSTGGTSTFGQQLMNYVKGIAETIIPQVFLVKEQTVKYRGDENAFDLMSSYYEQPSIIDKVKKGTQSDRLKRIVSNGNNTLYKINDFETISYKKTIQSVYKDNDIKTVDSSIGRENYGLPTTGKFDKINILKVIDGASMDDSDGSLIQNTPLGQYGYDIVGSDLISFFFYDVVNDVFIPFRATIKGLTENINAPWEEMKFVGRSDSLYSYSGFTRTLNFSFFVSINSIVELAPTWNRLNYLASMMKPSKYTTNGANKYDNFVVSPMIMLTVGDLYKWQPLILTSLSFVIPDDAIWETYSEINGKDWSYYLNKIQLSDNLKDKIYVGQVPRQIEISLTCNLLEKEQPITGGTHFGHYPYDRQLNQVIKGDKVFLPDPNNLPFSKNLPKLPTSETANGTVIDDSKVSRTENVA